MRTTTPATGTRHTSAVLHGRHPLRGYEVTWHLTPLPTKPRGTAEFLVERADGHIEDPTVWELAEKEVFILDTPSACELVRRASPPVR